MRFDFLLWSGTARKRLHPESVLCSGVLTNKRKAEQVSLRQQPRQQKQQLSGANARALFPSSKRCLSAFEGEGCPAAGLCHAAGAAVAGGGGPGGDVPGTGRPAGG
eukprot:EG_transcript_39789